MFELDITRDFSAAHSLRGYNGDCSALHGHNWTVQVFVVSRELDKVGIAMDFKLLKKELNEVLAEFDHKYLNDLPAFAGRNPTSENIAMYIYQRLKPVVTSVPGASLSRVRVCESPTSGASYSE
ncbi:MAG: 6-carboxytetrahydropterin synthase QueD [Lentisphaeria bacterium]|nr:6-carboxytetrahydropterin synthase QueD [Lentisphaeria bacterium]